MASIDINNILAQSNVKMLRNLPPFAVRWIKRIIYLNEINKELENLHNRKGSEFHNAILESLNIEVEYKGIENLPENSRCFFVANHPFGILDGLMLTKMLLEKYGDCKAIGNVAFDYIPQLRPYVISNPSDPQKHKEFALEMDRIFASITAVSHFPAGYVSRLFKGKIRDIPWKKTFVSKAITHQRDIVPMHFEGKNSNLFYIVNMIRRLLGIKMNIEYVLLPHELFNKKNRKYTLIIGKPISFTSLDNSKNHQDWANEIRKISYSFIR